MLKSYITEEAKRTLNHYLLQTLIVSNADRTGVVPSDSTHDLEFVNDGRPVIIKKPIPVSTGGSVMGLVVKPDVSLLDRFNFLHHAKLASENPGMVPLMVIYGMHLTEVQTINEIEGELYFTQPENLAVESFELYNTVLANEHLFQESNKSFTELSIDQKNFNYVTPDLDSVEKSFLPQVTEILALADNYEGRGFTVKNIQDLETAPHGTLMYVHNPNNIESGANTFGANNFVIKTGSVIYKLTKEEAAALAWKEIEGEERKHYFLSLLLWYTDSQNTSSTPVMYTVFGVDSVEGLEVAEYTDRYGSALTNSSVELTKLGLEAVDGYEPTYTQTAQQEEQETHYVEGTTETVDTETDEETNDTDNEENNETGEDYQNGDRETVVV